MKTQTWKIIGLLLAAGGSVAWAQTETETNAVPPQRMAKPSPEERLKRFDADGDGVLSDAERQAARESMRRERRDRRPGREEMRQQFDADGDGQLSESEQAAMQAAMKSRRNGAPRMSREEMLNRFDSDGDGQLSETERQAMHDALKAEREAQAAKPPAADAPAETSVIPVQQ